MQLVILFLQLKGLTHSAFDSVLDIVLKGTKNCTLSVGKHWMNSKNPGTVLNIVTTYSWTGSAYVVPSACAKLCPFGYDKEVLQWNGQNMEFVSMQLLGTIPQREHGKRLLPGDLVEKFDMKKSSVKKGRRPSGISKSCSYLVSWISLHILTEKLFLIDGGEWLQGSWEFNMLEAIPQGNVGISWKLNDKRKKKS